MLVAFSLRSAVASLSPILIEIQAEISVPSWIVGLIGAAPPVCFALFGIITPALERRFGLEPLAVGAMLIAAVCLTGRALAPNAGFLLGATVVLFAAIGVGNVVIPPLVKVYFPDRIGTMTAVYSTTLAVSSFIPPLVAIPIADAVGWRFSLGQWAVFAVLAMIPWLALAWGRRSAPDTGDIAEPTPRVLGRLTRLPMAWALVLSFAMSSATVYTAFAWLPIILVQSAHVSHGAAGALLALMGGMGLPLSMLVPFVITRFRRVGVLYVVAAVCGIAGLVGLIVAPATATVLWIVLFGIPQLLFSAVLVLVQLRARTHEGSVALSGFVQSCGYAIAALFPLLFGILHDATGGWTLPLALLAALMLVAIPAGIVASRPHTIEDEWEKRHGAWT